MADTTSVGVIQLDVEINPKSLNLEMDKLGKAFNNSFKNMFSGMMGQTNNFVRDSISKIGSSFKNFTQVGIGSSEKVSRSISKMNSEYEKTEAKISKIRSELAKLFAEQDVIVRSYQDFPALSGLTKDETIEQLLKSDPKFNELSTQIDKLISELDPLVAKNKELAEEIENVGDKADNTGKKFSKMGSSAKKAGKSIFNLSWMKRMFSNESKKATNAASNFGNTMSRVSRMIARNLIVYGLIIKGLKGMISYMWSAFKTNQQFVHSLSVIRTNLLVAFQPIYSFVLPALNTLMQAVATVTTYIASAISALFGKTYQQSFGAAKSMNKAIKGMDGYGKAAKKAGKEAKGALMGFDEINQLDIKDDSDDTGGGGGGGAGDFEMTMPDTSTIDLSGLERFKEIIASIIEPFKLAWENEGQNTINAIKDAFSSILDLSKSIGKSWLEVWTNGTGQKTVENILKILQNIFNIAENLATAFKNAWNENEVGTRIIQGMFDIFNTILETIGKITKSTAEWAKTLNFTPLLESISTLLKALKPLTQNIGDGLVWLWENALLPLAGWVIEDALPSFLRMLAGAIEVLNGVIEILKPLFKWLWDEVLEPLAKWTGGAIIDVLDGITLGFEKVVEWLEELKAIIGDSQGFWDAAFKIGKHIVEGLFEGIVSIVKGVGSWLKENLIDPIVNGVKKLFGIQSPSTVFMEIGVWLIEGLFQGISNTWTKVTDYFDKQIKTLQKFFSGAWKSIKNEAEKIWNGIKDFFTKTWDNIKTKTSETWNNIKSFLIDKIWTPIKNTAKTMWEGIKKNILDPINQAWSNLKSIWDKIKKYILDKWNEIKTGISSMKDNLVNAIKEPFNIAKNWIDGIIGDAFNWGKNLIGNFIDGIKSMARKVTDAVSGVVGGIKDFLGFSSPTKKGPGSDADKWMPNMMEMFAAGIEDNIAQVSSAINMTAGSIQQGIQPNTDDMASSIGNAVAGAIQVANTGGNSTDRPVEVDLIVDGNKLGRVVINSINSLQKQEGRILLEL